MTDRDGMYVHVTAKGAMSFRMDYRLNGRRETIYLGKYGPDGLSLARARESASTQGATSLLDILIALKSYAGNSRFCFPRDMTRMRRCPGQPSIA